MFVCPRSGILGLTPSPPPFTPKLEMWLLQSQTRALDVLLLPVSELFFFTIITCKACLESTAPILFELSCEQAYPIGEGMTTMLLTYTNNILALVFLSVSSLPNIGSEN